MHDYSQVSPTEFNVTYSQVSLYRIATYTFSRGMNTVETFVLLSDVLNAIEN